MISLVLGPLKREWDPAVQCGLLSSLFCFSLCLLLMLLSGGTSLFDMHEPSKRVFGTDENSMIFKHKVDAHAKSLVLLVDGVFQMLTNQPEMMDQVFQQLGEKHEAAMIDADLFPHMGQAIGHTLGTFLEEPLTEGEVAAWGEVYTALAYEITRFYGSEVDETRENIPVRDYARAAPEKKDKSKSKEEEGADAEPDYAALLTAFYEEHNPNKVGSVPTALKKYKVRFPLLVLLVCAGLVC